MKRIIHLLPLTIILFLVTSCNAFFTSGSYGSVTVTTPTVQRSAEAREVEGDDQTLTIPPSFANGAPYSFKIRLTDSVSNVQIIEAVPGQAVVFNKIPKGKAEIKITAFDNTGDQSIAKYAGSTTIDVKAGKNEAIIPMHNVRVQLVIPGGEARWVVVDDLTISDFTVSEENVPGGKVFAWWYNSDAGTKEKVTSDAALSTFKEHLTGDDTIVAKFGVEIDNLVNYVTAAGNYAEGGFQPAVSGEEILVLNSSGTTKIPTFNNKTIPVTGITLDFSGSTVKTVDTYAFSINNKWVSTIKLPSTMTSISYTEGIIDKMYIAFPSGTTVISQSSGIADSASTYSVYFDGTLADFAGRLKVPNTSGGNLVEAGIPLYVKDSSGKWINSKTAGMKFESTYNSGSGETPLTTITSKLFRKANTPFIELPDSVETIESSAFTYSTASRVNLGSGVKRITGGALYSNVPRTFYYNGTIDDWMKIGCAAKEKGSADVSDGGPFLGGTDTFYVKNANGSYVRAYQDNGTLSFTVTTSNVTTSASGSTLFADVSGQLQGLKKLREVVINGESGTTYTIGDYAFSGCSDLETVRINAKVTLGNHLFTYTGLSDLWLNSNEKCTIASSSTPFYNMTGVTVHVPADLLTSYQADTNWSAAESNGQIELVGIPDGSNGGGGSSGNNEFIGG